MDHSESQEERGIYGKCKRGVSVTIGSYGRATPGFYFIFFTYSPTVVGPIFPALLSAPSATLPPTTSGITSSTYNKDVQRQTGTEEANTKILDPVPLFFIRAGRVRGVRRFAFWSSSGIGFWEKYKLSLQNCSPCLADRHRQVEGDPSVAGARILRLLHTY